jgi:anti-sigma-K factor RskA
VNIQEYISSGIIESYVLGLASPEERTAFEENCRLYPELVEARHAFELSLEKLAMENAVTPAPSLKEKIMESIREKQPVTVVRMSWWRYAAAACLILLAGSVYWNITLYNQNRVLKTDYTGLVAKMAEMENEIRVVTHNPHVKMASLKGMPSSPQSLATVYWDTASHDVYLMLNNLPKPASGKQYQLWAFIDGKPVDMGMIDNEYFIKETSLLIRGKGVRHAQAFAITLESRDRPDTSTPQGTLYVMGNL